MNTKLAHLGSWSRLSRPDLQKNFKEEPQVRLKKLGVGIIGSNKKFNLCHTFSRSDVQYRKKYILSRRSLGRLDFTLG